MSYALSRLPKLNAQPSGLLSGLLNSRQIAAAGHSDGGDTVAALAANTCCTDHRLAAVEATHMSPYSGMNRGERIAARVTPAFFNRYVLGRTGALGTITRDGNVRGTAALVSGGHLPSS
jgi:hypothetical protein